MQNVRAIRSAIRRTQATCYGHRELTGAAGDKFVLLQLAVRGILQTSADLSRSADSIQFAECARVRQALCGALLACCLSGPSYAAEPAEVFQRSGCVGKQLQQDISSR